MKKIKGWHCAVKNGEIVKESNDDFWARDDEGLKKISTPKLIKEARALDEMIYEIECYGTSDIRKLYSVEKELNRRGYTTKRKTEWVKDN